MLTIIRIGTWLTAILVLSLASASLFAAPPSGGGGGGKISVTAANPSEAFQGEELDVIVTGSGFDAGSTVSYLVTGTTDASQVEVLSVQVISSTELRTRIRPKDAALPIEYDIEVRTLSGRKGKGTTLFRVKISDGCTGSEPKNPTIAYLTEAELIDGIYTADIVLSDSSGCEQQILLADAVQFLPDTPENEGVDRFIRNVRDLRLNVSGDWGVASWHDPYQDYWVQMGVMFELNPDGTILLDTPEPIELFRSPVGHNVWDADVRISELGEVKLAMVEIKSPESERYLSVYHYDSGTYQVLGAGDCQLSDSNHVCFVPDGYMVRWSPSGDAIYFSAEDAAAGYGQIIGRVRSQQEIWSQPEVVVEKVPGDRALYLESVSVTDLLVFVLNVDIVNKGGKRVGTDVQWGVLDLDQCAFSPCISTDALIFPEIRGTVWTPSNTLLQIDTSGQNTLREYTDPTSGSLSNLAIPGVQAGEFDSSL